MKPFIVFTGGGSGGHVIPAITMIKFLQHKIDAIYIGGSGIERELIPSLISFHQISTGKLRRYFSLKNFTDFFRFLKGIIDAFRILLKYRKRNPIIFSTGGFVSLPVVIAAWLLRNKIVIHEQTSRIGLANKIATFFATTALVSFKESLENFPKNKTFVSGYPLRSEIFNPEINFTTLQNHDLTKITKKILLVTGGGNGSKLINDLIFKNKDKLTKDFFVLHQVGKTNFEDYPSSKDYLTFDFSFALIDLFKMASIVISRAGAGTVSELIALNKPTIFIPLKLAQKNEQYFNAKIAVTKIPATIILEDDLIKTDLLQTIQSLINQQIYPITTYDAKPVIEKYLYKNIN